MRVELLNDFQRVFGSDADRMFFAPGRVNLIGEHTDYNGGHVFPCAICLGTYVAVKKREDRLVRVHSLNFAEEGIITFSVDDLNYVKSDGWANYPKGMMASLVQDGHQLESGIDLLFYGNLPNGAGLSSSASLELVTGVALQELFHLDADRIRLVQLGMKTENDFIGVNSGIMDQFAIGMGKEGYGILLDVRSLEHEYAPLPFDGHSLVIMNTNKRRELASSKYNERRLECEKALSYLQRVVGIETLGDLSLAEFEKYEQAIPDAVLKKRARHAVSENVRTVKAFHLLNQHRLGEFGELMNASHVSLKEDYDVTGRELDVLVEAAWRQPGVLGARMTGAGFGGCAIALVENAHVQAFVSSVSDEYKRVIGYEASFFTAESADGAKEWKGRVIV
ncbi:galactokinase [Rossellomorea marisflavi]|uniref:galactokinase n=1 Tax=Rossellomorea marisflavi TaxID=189381 RepID=UPI001653C44D|nr:galactokinase [Rossellomorea marisflavi]